MKSMAMKKNTVLGGDDVVANVGYSSAGLSEPSKPEYPYCLKLFLGPDELKMLGIEKMPEINSMMELEAKVKVVGIRSDERGNYVDLQITDMMLDNDKDEEIPLENIMYGG